MRHLLSSLLSHPIAWVLWCRLGWIIDNRNPVIAFSWTFPCSWKSKKLNIISHSSVEAKYCALATTTCELQWLVYLLCDLLLSIQSLLWFIATFRVHFTLLLILCSTSVLNIWTLIVTWPERSLNSDSCESYLSHLWISGWISSQRLSLHSFIYYFPRLGVLDNFQYWLVPRGVIRHKKAETKAITKAEAREA